MNSDPLSGWIPIVGNENHALACSTMYRATRRFCVSRRDSLPIPGTRSIVTGSKAVQMHELAIAESVIEAVLERTGDKQVTCVRLTVGRLAGVVPDALAFCFELAAAGTALEGAELEMVHLSGRAHCRSCDQDFRKDDLVLLCQCGSADVEVVAGRELSVTSVEVA